MATVDQLDSEQPLRVAIILVNWNAWRHCIECLDSVFAQNHRQFHVFLVDNDSQDASVENIENWCAHPAAEHAWVRFEGVRRLTDKDPPPTITYRVVDRSEGVLPSAPERCRLTLIRAGDNLGFAGGCNLGVRAAGLDNFAYFWFLNTDTVVHAEALQALLCRAISAPGAGIVGSTLRYYDIPETVQVMGGARLDMNTMRVEHIGEGCRIADVAPDPATVERDLAYVHGASMLVSAGFIRDIGPMSEDYFLYWEEIDWAMRAQGRYSLRYAANSHVFHKSGASSWRARRAFAVKLFYRNRILFTSRFFPHRLSAARRGLWREVWRYALKGRLKRAYLIASAIRDAAALPDDAAPRSEHLFGRNIQQ